MKTTNKQMEKKNVFEMVTARIVAQLEQGIIPWQRPWGGVAEGAISHESGKPYSLVNQMLLGKDGEWLTWKQIHDKGGRIKAGEPASFVVFWKRLQYELKQETEDEEVETESGAIIKTAHVLKYYNVWHIDQVDGIEPKWSSKEVRSVATDADAEKVISEYVGREGITFLNSKPSNRAFYRPSTDTVVVPMPEQYENVAEYYSTTFHELTHSTGHVSRLNRLTKTSAFGDENYSREELVAEMGAAYMCTMLNVDTEKAFQNSAAYIQGWLRALKNDNRMLVRAAGKAEAAVKFILNGKEAAE